MVFCSAVRGFSAGFLLAGVVKFDCAQIVFLENPIANTYELPPEQAIIPALWRANRIFETHSRKFVEFAAEALLFPLDLAGIKDVGNRQSLRDKR